MPLGGGGGGGAGGGGIILRTPVDMFNGATRTAAETARDAAITDTAPFDDNPSLAIILTWPVVVTDTVYQVRRNDAWADITGVVRGPTGASGRNGVDGTDGTDGGDGAPGGGALSLVGTATLVDHGHQRRYVPGAGFRLAGYGYVGADYRQRARHVDARGFDLRHRQRSHGVHGRHRVRGGYAADSSQHSDRPGLHRADGCERRTDRVRQRECCHDCQCA